MSDKTTIRKLAEELSLSRSTVHRALSGHPSVHQETRQKVLNAARKKGYELFEYKKNIVIIVPSSNWSEYLNCILTALEKEFRRRGFLLEMLTHKDIDLLKNYMFGGIVSLVWMKGMEKTLPQMFPVPILTVNAASNMLESVPAVMSDPHGIRIALDYLYARGCRRICFITTITKFKPDSALRLEEFRKFCLETGQNFESMYQETASAEAAVPMILRTRPDACFCASEEFAVRIGIELKKAGVHIPEDISLMGLETRLLNECFSPPITAIRQDFEQIAAVTAESMYQAIVNRIPPTCATIPFQLIERESVRQPPEI